MKTLILILLDESGSMASQKNDVIGGFNTFIQEQKEIKADEANVTFIKFNTTVSLIHNCEPIENIPNLIFSPGGGTSLYDAIWEGIQMVEKIEKDFDRIICVIMTDGEDTSSRNITFEGIGKLMKKKELEGKWTFLYIGENPERWAKQTGISVNNVRPYNHETQRANFNRAQRGVENIRSQSKPRMDNALWNVE